MRVFPEKLLRRNITTLKKNYKIFFILRFFQRIPVTSSLKFCNSVGKLLFSFGFKFHLILLDGKKVIFNQTEMRLSRVQLNLVIFCKKTNEAFLAIDSSF